MTEYTTYIKEHLDASLLKGKEWWISYVYHFSNIDNIVNILKENAIYSRNKSQNLQLMFNENASVEVIGQTEERVLDFVRLYFRPKTPTQYHNEGFKTRSMRNPDYLSAHIPVPIFLAFDLDAIFHMEGVQFSQVSLAIQGTPLWKGFEAFKELDFPSIYHEGRMQEEMKEDLIHKRHAEIVIKDQLSLTHLKRIWCRSHGEYVTLVNLLRDAGILENYKNLISVKQADVLFFMSAVFVDYVNLQEDYIDIFIRNIPKQASIKLKVELLFESSIITKSAILKDTYTSYRCLLQSYAAFIKRSGNYAVKLYFVDMGQAGQSYEYAFVYYGKWCQADELPY